MELEQLTGGSFLMGTDDNHGFSEDYEGPATEVKVKPFKIGVTTVTNDDFAQFVKATGYKTTAEKYGTSFVFHIFVDDSKKEQYEHVAGAPWWLLVPGADWQHPFGPDSSINDLMDHPVVHVSLEDALAFCDWSHTTLPTEAQWEYAARGGVKTEYPWGTSLTENNEFHANTWQGDFPWKNSQDDGYVGTAPVKTYNPNNYDLYQMIGNVWEWSRNPRYILLDDFNTNDYELKEAPQKGEYAIRGGSFLCHCSYCNRYRLSARNGVDCLSTSSHLGFRCVKQDA